MGKKRASTYIFLVITTTLNYLFNNILFGDSFLLIKSHLTSPGFLCFVFFEFSHTLTLSNYTFSKESAQV